MQSKIYDQRDDFDFDIGNVSYLDGDVPHRASYGENISQLIKFGRVCNHVTNFNARKQKIKIIMPNFSSNDMGIINFEKHFLILSQGTMNFFSKFNSGLKTLLREGLSEPEIYDDLVYKVKKLEKNVFFFVLFSLEKSSYATNV